MPLNCAASAHLYTLHFTPQLFCYPSPLFLFSSRYTCRVKLCHLFCFCQWSGKYPSPLNLTLYTSTILKIPFPCTLPNSSVLITKDEPKKNQGTTKELPVTKKSCFLRLPSLSPLLYLASFYRENSDRRPRDEEVPRMALRVLRPNYPHSKGKAQYIE